MDLLVTASRIAPGRRWFVLSRTRATRRMSRRVGRAVPTCCTRLARPARSRRVTSRAMASIRVRAAIRTTGVAWLILSACGGKTESDADEVSSFGAPCPEDLPLCPPDRVPIDGCICRTPPTCEEGAVRCVGAVSQSCTGYRWASLEVCISAELCIDSAPGGCITPEGTPPACKNGEFVCPGIPDGGCVPCTDGRWRQPPPDTL